MASETGWTKEFPKVDGDYFCRLNEHDLCPVSFRLENGKIYEYGCGGNLYSQYVAKWDDYEYLGPFSASDAEQLSELRKALSETIVGEDGLRDILSRTFHSPQFSADVYALDVRRLTRTVLALRQAALAARDCLTTSRQGFTEWPEADAILEQLRTALNPQPEKETQGR